MKKTQMILPAAPRLLFFLAALCFILFSGFSISSLAREGNSSSSGFAPELSIKKIERTYFFEGKAYKCEIFTEQIKIFKNDKLVMEKTKAMSENLQKAVVDLQKNQTKHAEQFCDDSDMQDYVFTPDRQLMGCLTGNDYIYNNGNTKTVYYIVNSLNRLCK
jgi:hypothetical protein